MSEWCAWSAFVVCVEWTPPSTNGLFPENLRAPISFIHYGTFVYPTIIALTAGSGVLLRVCVTGRDSLPFTLMGPIFLCKSLTRPFHTSEPTLLGCNS